MTMRLHLRIIVGLCMSAVFCGSVRGGDRAALEFFESKVRPILAHHCYECHGPEKQKSDLRLDHISTILRGGERGPALVRGDVEASRIVEAARYQNTDLQMPPRRKLADEQIAVLEQWIAMGAPWPDEPAPAGEASGRGTERYDVQQRKAEHWAWRPIRKAVPPRVARTDWPLTEIDRFILAALEAAGVAPAPPADRTTWLRRVHLDLIGLPPTVEQVRQFLDESSPDAYEKVVDRLLCSPRFGERWARHWMDLVRYAETYGHEFDFPIPQAWRYRDYLIRALNADVPYDQLVREHIAGDLLERPRRHLAEGYNESVIATGFWYLHEQTHAPTDVRQHQAERIDNQIDVMTKTFLGLTVACARCHDHKFDAISTADYYALAGFLQSSRQDYAMLDPGGTIAQGVERLRELYDGVVKHQRAEVPSSPATQIAEGGSDAAVFASFDNDLEGWTASGFAFLHAPEPGAAHSGLLGRRLHGVLRSPTFTITQPKLFICAAGENAKLRVIIDGYIMDEFNPLLFAGLIASVDTGGKFNWFTIQGDYGRYVGHRAYIEVIDGGDGWIAVDEVRFGRGEAPPEASSSTGAGRTPYIIPDSIAAEMRRIDEQLPAPVRVLAMTDGTAEDSPVFIRGSHRTPGDLVPRRFLEALSGPDQPPIEHGSGRLELARRLLDESNPFAARVAVNRLWHHLFGRGIVPTVDNFGVLGQPPSHPELLDYLALELQRCGWSQKSILRQIVLSQTYRMSSAPADAHAQRVDPTNVLLHRMNIKRLEGEAIRDALLAVSGRLDGSMYGPPVAVHLTPFMDGRGRPGQSGPLDGAGRRSVYLEARRNFLSPFMLAFDTPTPFTAFGQRTVSNVPAQSLILMNDPFIVEQARLWAAGLMGNPRLSTLEEQVEQMYLAAFARCPTREEQAAAQRFSQRQTELYGSDADDLRLLADLAHALFNVKEFVFVP